MTKSKTRVEKDTETFEGTARRLQSIIETLESDDSGIEQSLKSFTEGMALIRQLQARLEESEQAVNTLLEEDTEPNTLERGLE